MAAVARHHAGHDQAAEVQDGPKVHVDKEIDVLVLGLEELLRPVDARVVDQDIERRLRRARWASAGRSVTSMTCAMQPVRSASACERLARCARSVDLESLPAEPLHDRGADARRSAGDKSGPDNRRRAWAVLC